MARGGITLDHTATLETDRSSASRWRLHDVLVSGCFQWLRNSTTAVSRSSPSDQIILEDTSG